MLYSLENVKDAIRTQEGRRVFWCYPGDRLTPAAEDWLKAEGIELLRRDAPPTEFRDLRGGIYREKPEELTHLSGQLLVPKTHPRIRFRGQLDSLQSEILLCAAHCPRQRAALEELLSVSKEMMRADVLGTALPAFSLGGMDERELRKRSHLPQNYYGQGHFQPGFGDSPALLQLNRLRTRIRETELCCCHAFTDRDGLLTRGDLPQALNRMSAFCYLLMIEEKARSASPEAHRRK